jgi:transglutaminase-like putative cysteine protease
LSEQERRLYLAPNQRVPVGGKPTELLDHLRLPSDPLEVARILYSCVDEHVRYDKSRPGYGNGDALWVCDSRFGNCTDFHSLFISLARSQQIPARFEIGFPLPVERGDGSIAGYHCWAFFHAKDRGWIPVDISEADKHPAMKEYYFGNLTENRVVLSTGRDIALVPKSASPLMNFFVYPHVEVDGKPIDKQQVELKVRYTDEE